MYIYSEYLFYLGTFNLESTHLPHAFSFLALLLISVLLMCFIEVCYYRKIARAALITTRPHVRSPKIQHYVFHSPPHSLLKAHYDGHAMPMSRGVGRKG